jgi:hypothetical protein
MSADFTRNKAFRVVANHLEQTYKNNRKHTNYTNRIQEHTNMDGINGRIFHSENSNLLNVASLSYAMNNKRTPGKEVSKQVREAAKTHAKLFMKAVRAHFSLEQISLDAYKFYQKVKSSVPLDKKSLKKRQFDFHLQTGNVLVGRPDPLNSLINPFNISILKMKLFEYMRQFLNKTHIDFAQVIKAGFKSKEQTLALEELLKLLKDTKNPYKVTSSKELWFMYPQLNNSTNRTLLFDIYANILGVDSYSNTHPVYPLLNIMNGNIEPNRAGYFDSWTYVFSMLELIHTDDRIQWAGSPTNGIIWNLNIEDTLSHMDPKGYWSSRNSRYARNNQALSAVQNENRINEIVFNNPTPNGYTLTVDEEALRRAFRMPRKQLEQEILRNYGFKGPPQFVQRKLLFKANRQTLGG